MARSSRSTRRFTRGRRYGCSLTHQSTVTNVVFAESRDREPSFKGGGYQCLCLTEESRYGVVPKETLTGRGFGTTPALRATPPNLGGEFALRSPVQRSNPT